jgi:hypothetical protein
MNTKATAIETLLAQDLAIVRAQPESAFRTDMTPVDEHAGEREVAPLPKAAVEAHFLAWYYTEAIEAVRAKNPEPTKEVLDRVGDYLVACKHRQELYRALITVAVLTELPETAAMGQLQIRLGRDGAPCVAEVPSRANPIKELVERLATVMTE